MEFEIFLGRGLRRKGIKKKIGFGSSTLVSSILNELIQVTIVLFKTYVYKKVHHNL